DGASFDLMLNTWPSAEAQVAALADDIAYNNHDVDDGLQAGLFGLEDLEDVPLIGPAVASVRRDYPGLDERMMRLEAVRRMIGVMVDDVLAETARRAQAAAVASPDDVRGLDGPLVAFSEQTEADLADLRAFLHARMYRHVQINRSRSQARRILRQLFELFMAEPDTLPAPWFTRVELKRGDEAAKARVICDYIAGMTDRYAIEEQRKLFNLDVWG
ncbi:MAG: deoxyguanosinetriphosphate triphosphohydrolase, partial [Caulobacteraceae bacterium]